MAGTIMTQEAFNAALASGKYSKTWLTNTMQRMQEHETKLALLAVLREDPQMKLWLGAATGSLVATMGIIASGNFADAFPEWAGVMDLKRGVGESGYQAFAPGTRMTDAGINEMIKEAVAQGYTVEDVMMGWVRKRSENVWIYIPRGYVYQKSTGEVITLAEAEERMKEHQKIPIIGDLVDLFGDLGGDWTKLFGNLAVVAGTSFAGMNLVCLMLSCTFSGTDLGEIGSAVGSILPG